MDRRISKTRTAIFQAFLDLLNEKGYDAMRVQDVIDRADVGRSTFYAHYASKEALLEELCQDLFHHLFSGREEADVRTLLAHIFKHFRTNQDRVARARYFSQGLGGLYGGQAESSREPAIALCRDDLCGDRQLVATRT